MDERITDLEIRLAYQDDLLETLNRVVAEQQQSISLMQMEIQHLYQKMKTLEPAAVRPLEDEPPPPHY